jgi:hypothetical protein
VTRRLPVLLASVLLAALAACGGGSGDGGEAAGNGKSGRAELRELVLTSAFKAAEVKTSRFEFTANVPGPEGKPISLTGRGAVDNSLPLISMEMDTGGLLPGAGTADATTAFVFDGKAFYMRFPEALAAQLGGKHWVRFDTSALSKQSGIDLDTLLAQFRSSDPLANLSLLTGAAEDVSEVGTEDVRGVSTRHLKVTVNLDKAVSQAAARFRPAVSQLTEQLGTDTLPVDVWIADDGLPRRLVYQVDLTKASVPGAEGATGTVKTTMEIFDYGKPIEATIPPAEDTADFADVVGQQGY